LSRAIVSEYASVGDVKACQALMMNAVRDVGVINVQRTLPDWTAKRHRRREADRGDDKICENYNKILHGRFPLW
jgi:hypothetical protein